MESNHKNKKDDSVDISDSTGNIDAKLRDMRSQNEFVRISDGEYLDLVFFPDKSDGIQVIDGMFAGKPTGRKKSLFLVHEVGL
jgi:hypothetical protein